MSFIAAAAIGAGGALVGGYLSGEASKDAAKTGSDAAGRSSAQVKAASDKARRDVLTYMPAARDDLLAGYSSAADIFGQGVPEQQRLLQSGNMNAQQTTAGGYDQYRSALMGMPVDQSNWQPQQVAQSAPIENPFKSLQFSNIGNLGQQQQQQALSGLTNNSQVISAIERGDLNVNGINTDWFRKVASERPGWFESDSLLSYGGLSPEARQSAIDSEVRGKNAHRYGDLVSQLNSLRG